MAFCNVLLTPSTPTIRSTYNTGERDTRSPHDRRIGLNTANGGTKADAHAGCRADKGMEYGMVVHVMDVIIGGAMTVSHAAFPAHVAHMHACVIPAKDNRGGLDAVCAQQGSKPPAEEACHVG